MVFSVSCGVHAVAASDYFSTMRSVDGNYSENDALRMFLDKEPQMIVDDCGGFVCNYKCKTQSIQSEL